MNVIFKKNRDIIKMNWINGNILIIYIKIFILNHKYL